MANLQFNKYYAFTDIIKIKTHDWTLFITMHSIIVADEILKIFVVEKFLFIDQN